MLSQPMERATIIRFAWAVVIVVSIAVEVPGQVVFEERAAAAGVDLLSFGRGAGMADLDGDGLLDIVASNGGMPNRFFRQLADHTFADANEEWGIEFDARHSWGVLVADFDNDGDPDVYFFNGGFGPPEPNQMLRNDLGTAGVFTDVSGFGGHGGSERNFGGTAVDFDRDGLLDVFLTTNDLDPCTLLRNLGDLSFEDVSAQAGLVDLGDYRHASSGDFDNDGWIDVAVGQFGGANRLYRNNGDGTFSDVAAAAGVSFPGPNFGSILEDFDNDGWLDIFVPRYVTDGSGTSGLFLNRGDGTFEDVSGGSGITSADDMGHNTGDLDGDGFPDIFVGTGGPVEAHLNLLYLVKPDAENGIVVTDVSEASNITSGGPSRCHGSAFGDYDQDGFVDIYESNGGPSSTEYTIEENALWRNLGNQNNWVGLQLTGVISNRSAIGARCVAVMTSGRTVRRSLRIGHGFGNSDSPIVHVGVRPEEAVERIDIVWPSGVTQTVLAPPLNQITMVIESTLIFGDAFESGDSSAWSGINFDLIVY